MAKRKKKLPKDSFSDDKLKAFLMERYDFMENAMVAHGLSDAFIGISVHERAPVLVYDINKILDILMKRDEMSKEEAIEFFEFNIASVKFSDDTHPIFITTVGSDWSKN